jgi:hypothetical protein
MITKTNQLSEMPITLSGDGYSLTIAPNAHERKQEILALSSDITKVSTNDESGDARVHLARLAAMRIEVDKCRKEIKEPVLRVGKLIDQAAKDFLSEIEMEECRIKGLIGDHANEVARLKAIAEAEERKAFEFARAAREAAEESGRIADVLAHKAAVAAKLAASNEVAETKVAQGVRFAWDFEVTDIKLLYSIRPDLVELTFRRSLILATLNDMDEHGYTVEALAAELGIRAFKKPVISAK